MTGLGNEPGEQLGGEGMMGGCHIRCTATVPVYTMHTQAHAQGEGCSRESVEEIRMPVELLLHLEC